jgi:hypothetical protein
MGYLKARLVVYEAMNREIRYVAVSDVIFTYRHLEHLKILLLEGCTNTDQTPLCHTAICRDGR